MVSLGARHYLLRVTRVPRFFRWFFPHQTLGFEQVFGICIFVIFIWRGWGFAISLALTKVCNCWVLLLSWAFSPPPLCQWQCSGPTENGWPWQNLNAPEESLNGKVAAHFTVNWYFPFTTLVSQRVTKWEARISAQNRGHIKLFGTSGHDFLGGIHSG